MRPIAAVLSAVLLVLVAAPVGAAPVVVGSADDEVDTHDATVTDPCGPGVDDPTASGSGRPGWPETDLCAVGLTQRVDSGGRLVGLELWLRVDGQVRLGETHARHTFTLDAPDESVLPVDLGQPRGCTLHVLVRSRHEVAHAGSCDGGGAVDGEGLAIVPAEVSVAGGLLTVAYEPVDLDVALRDLLARVAASRSGRVRFEAVVGRPPTSLQDGATGQLASGVGAPRRDHLAWAGSTPLHGVAPAQRCTDRGRRLTAGTPVATHLCRGLLGARSDEFGELDALVLRWELRSDPAAAGHLHAVLRAADGGCEVVVVADRVAGDLWRVAADGAPGEHCAPPRPGGTYVAGEVALAQVNGAVVTQDATGVEVVLPVRSGNRGLAGLAQPGRVLDGGEVSAGPVSGAVHTVAGLDRLVLPG